MMKKIIFIALGCLCTALGFIGIFLPVLPTTPLILLAAFLFSRSSERFNNWLQGTRVYNAYVVPFKRDGGVTRKKKIRMLAVSYGVMLISALIVRKLIVCLILLAVACWLFYYIGFRLRTIEEESEGAYELPAEEKSAEEEIKEI